MASGPLDQEPLQQAALVVAFQTKASSAHCSDVFSAAGLSSAFFCRAACLVASSAREMPVSWKKRSLRA